MIINARNGDQEAFKELIRRYEHRVAVTVISMLGHCPEAEDVGQETFIQFYRSLGRYRGEASIGTYITSIAINLSLNELRRRKRRRGLFYTKSGDTVENIPDTENKEGEREMKNIVRKAIQELDPKHRAVIVLRLINGYSTDETAQILNLPIGTVLSRLARGQMKLRTILKPQLGGQK